MATTQEMTSPIQTPPFYQEQGQQQQGRNSNVFDRLNPLIVTTAFDSTSNSNSYDDFITDWDRNISSIGSTTASTASTFNGMAFCPIDEGNSTGYGHEFYVTAQMVTGLFIYPSFCFPGLVGNLLTVVVLSQRNMLTSTNAFLSALAVSDSIKLINDSLYFFVTLFFNIDPVLGNLSYGYLYPYAHFIFSMSVCVSSWLTVSVAVERYILVCHPTRARNIWSRKRAVTLCCIIYIVMTSIALPSAFRYRTIRCFDVQLNASRLEVELTEMWQNEAFVTSYTWAQNLLRSIIPLVLLVVLNVCIIRAVSRTRIKKKRKTSKHRVTIMMIVVILAFLICITPDAILSTIFGRGYHEAGNMTKGIREITDTLLTINAAVNFIIYCALNKVFRKSFTHLCCPRSRRKGDGWVTEMDESVYRRYSESKASMMSNNNHSSHRHDPEAQSEKNYDNNSAFSPSSPKSAISSEGNCTDSNKFRYSSLSGGPSSPESPGFCSERLAFFPNSSTKQNASMTDSTMSDGYAEKYNQRKRQNNRRFLNNQYRNSWNDSQNHQHKHPKSSSHGLKKSRNSVKCNRGKRSANGSSGDFSDENYEPFQNETVTYVPKEDFQDTMRRLSSGKKHNRLSASKFPDTNHVENVDQQGKLNSEKKLVLDLKTNKEMDSFPLSPDSAPYTPHNHDSPATLNSDVMTDEQYDAFQNDVTICDADNDVIETNSVDTYSINNPTSSEQHGAIISDDNYANEDSSLLASHDEGCDVPENSRQLECGESSEQPINGNKIKKRPLTVSFSDC